MANNYRKKKVEQTFTYVPVGDPALLATPIEELGLHEKTLAVLQAGKLTALYDICQRTERDLFKIQGFNKKSLLDIQKYLSNKALTLAPDATPIEKPATPQTRQSGEDTSAKSEKAPFDRKDGKTERAPRNQERKGKENGRDSRDQGGKENGRDSRDQGGKENGRGPRDNRDKNGRDNSSREKERDGERPMRTAYRAVKDYRPIADEDTLNTQLAVCLSISQGTLETLTRAKILTMGDLAMLTEQDVRSMRRLGRNGEQEVKTALTHFGLTLAPMEAYQTDAPAPAVYAEQRKNNEERRAKEERRQEQFSKPQKKEQPQKGKSAPDYSARAIEKLNFSRRTFNALRLAKLNTVGDIIRLTEAQLLAVNGINKPIIDEIEAKLLSLSLYLAEPPVSYEDNPVRASMEKRTRERTRVAPVIVENENGYKKFAQGNKYGYKDAKGVVVIPAVYDEISLFREGLAYFEQDELFGYIDQDNNVVIPADTYDCAAAFSEGLACVSKNNKCGYINKQGEVVIPFLYDAGTYFSEGSARVKQDGKWGAIDIDGNVKWIK